MSSSSFCSSEAVAIGDIADGGNSGLYLLGSPSAMVAELQNSGLTLYNPVIKDDTANAMQPPRRPAAPLSRKRIVSLPPTRLKERPSIIARASVSARCTISWSTSPPGELPTPSCLFGGFLGMGEGYRPLPALEGTQLRYAPGRVGHRSRPQPDRESAELCEQRAELVQPDLPAAGSTSFTACRPIGP